MEWDEEASSKDEVKKKHKFDDWDLSKSDSSQAQTMPLDYVP